MFPDVDPRKNSITILEAIQSSAQIAKALQATEPIRALTHKQRAQDLWRFFTDVGLLGDDSLVRDNVTGTADGLFHCCNSTVKPYCEARNTITWSYNQGMFLGAMVDMHALTGDDSYLKKGLKNQKLTLQISLFPLHQRRIYHPLQKRKFPHQKREQLLFLLL